MTNNKLTGNLDQIETIELVRALIRRLGLRFGKVILTAHDGEPSDRIVIERREHRSLK